MTLARLVLPCFLTPVHAGFPSPGDEFVDSKLDLNELLIQKPVATYFLRVSGDSMVDMHILDGDLLVVDRSVDPVNSSIVIACLNGEFTIKQFYKSADGIKLKPANKKYKPIKISDSDEFEIFGVVQHVIHSFIK